MSWETHKLAEIASFKTGKLNSNAAVLGGEFPFFTCAQETFQIDKYAFDTEAVLLAGNNANGVFALKYYNGRFNAYQRTYILEPLNPERLNTRFLYFALRPALKRFESESIGATTQYLTKGILDNFKIKVPDLPAQKRIAEVLSAYDDLIENNRRRITLLEQAARLLYREWFVHFCFPGHETAKFVDGLPKGWENCNVEDKYDSKSGGTPSRKREEFFKGEINWVKTQELDEGFIRKTEERISEDAVKHSSAKVFPKLTLLMSIYGGTNIGRTAVLAEVGTCNQASLGFFPTENADDWIYLQKWIQENRGYLISLAQGAAQTNISQKTVKGLSLIWPEREILSEYYRLTKPALLQMEILRGQTEQLTRARDLLLPRLMDGRLPV